MVPTRGLLVSRVVGRGLSRSGRVLSQSSFLSRFSPYAFLLAGHRQRGLGPLRRPEERHHSSTQAPSTHLRACRRSSPSSSRPWSHRAPRRTKAETGAKVALRPLPLRGIAPFKASVKRLLTPPHGRVSRVRVDRAPSSTSSPERGFKSERADASAAKSTAKSHRTMRVPLVANGVRAVTERLTGMMPHDSRKNNNASPLAGATTAGTTREATGTTRSPRRSARSPSASSSTPTPRAPSSTTTARAPPRSAQPRGNARRRSDERHRIEPPRTSSPASRCTCCTAGATATDGAS